MTISNATLWSFSSNYYATLPPSIEKLNTYMQSTWQKQHIHTHMVKVTSKREESYIQKSKEERKDQEMRSKPTRHTKCEIYLHVCFRCHDTALICTGALHAKKETMLGWTSFFYSRHAKVHTTACKIKEIYSSSSSSSPPAAAAARFLLTRPGRPPP